MQKKMNLSLIPLKVKLLTKEARMPEKGSVYSAGYDLYASQAKLIPKKCKALVKIGIAMAIPEGCYGRIAPRSGLAVKKFIDVGAGVIDSDYRGEIRVLLFNFGEEDFVIEEGDRIAQLIIERIALTKLEEVTTLDETNRGVGGFGSTGVKGGIKVSTDKENRE